jgi:hypothetical protein
MGDDNLHWSERAKLASPGGLPPSVPRAPPPRKSRKNYVLAGAGVVVVAVIAAAVVVFLHSTQTTASTSTVSVATPLAQVTGSTQASVSSEGATGTSAGLLILCTEEQLKEKNWPLFDKTIGSIKLTR